MAAVRLSIAPLRRRRALRRRVAVAVRGRAGHAVDVPRRQRVAAPRHGPRPRIEEVAGLRREDAAFLYPRFAVSADDVLFDAARRARRPLRGRLPETGYSVFVPSDRLRAVDNDDNRGALPLNFCTARTLRRGRGVLGIDRGRRRVPAAAVGARLLALAGEGCRRRSGRVSKGVLSVLAPPAHPRGSQGWSRVRLQRRAAGPRRLGPYATRTRRSEAAYGAPSLTRVRLGLSGRAPNRAAPAVRKPGSPPRFRRGRPRRAGQPEQPRHLG